MGNKVELVVTAGPMKGKAFSFEEHDTFLFGRATECHCCLPDDRQVSRRHFIIEVNPPASRIRDFGSLNGTHVNDKKIGSREKGETSEQGQKRKYPEVDLKDGDAITAGQTILSVSIECEKAEGPVQCGRCGRDVKDEVGGRQVEAYICEACRRSIQVDPAEVMIDLLLQEAPSNIAQAGNKRKGVADLPVIAGYQILKRLAVGSYGAVYLAEKEGDRTRVAVKVMLSRTGVDDKARRGFMREIELLKALKHENVVSLLGAGAAGGGFYFVMEYCPMGSVFDMVVARGGGLSLEEATPIMLQAICGLAFVHGQGIVHRDIKPPNILLAGSKSQPTAKIADLGLAKNFDMAGFSGMTVTGEFGGTPGFLPREQIVNYKYVKPMSDVWSIGATFYHMLTGKTPHDFPRGSDPLEVILRGEVVPIRKRSKTIPVKLAEVIDRAIQVDPKARYQDGGEMKEALEEALL